MKIKQFLKGIWEAYSKFNYQHVMMLQSYFTIDPIDTETKPKKLKEQTSEETGSDVSTQC